MHVPSSLELSDDALEELSKYKDALRKYYQSMDMACVFFERNFASRHMQMQVCATPPPPPHPPLSLPASPGFALFWVI
jgi:hypothetical protein